jgi:hypothetical protein
MEIIRDTREQKNYFTFKSYADVRIIEKKLDTGDYSSPSFENKVTVDRKNSAQELYINFGTDSKRFDAELERMKSIEFAYFVCSFPYSHLESFPVNSGIPSNRWHTLKIKGSYLRMRVKEIEEKYSNIKFIFCKNVFEAEEVTYRILKEHIDGR